jgi:hypothetical protein
MLSLAMPVAVRMNFKIPRIAQYQQTPPMAPHIARMTISWGWNAPFQPSIPAVQSTANAAEQNFRQVSGFMGQVSAWPIDASCP